MGHCDNQTRDSIVPTAHSNYVDRNGVLTMDRSGFNVNRTVDYTNTNWMANIPDSRRIGELSIPGTHGTMALHGGIGGHIFINQTMNLTTQLNSGIRYIDIRCRHYHNNFSIHHNLVYQGAFFGPDVLEPVIRFLRQNPSETILMRIKEEYNPRGNTRTFSETFESFWNANQRYFWNLTSLNPTLGEVRGRIIVLQDFPGFNRNFGIGWGQLDIQDQWQVSINQIYNKWISIKNHFHRIRNTGHLSINHLSGNGGFGGPTPWFIASGYRSRNNNSLLDVASSRPVLTGWADFPRDRPTIGPVYWGGMNVLATKRMLDRRFTHTGIVAADFPGRGLIEGTIALNFPDIFMGTHQIVSVFAHEPVFDLNVGNSRVILYNNHFGNNQRWRFEFDRTWQVYRISSVSHPNLLLTGSDNPAVGGPHYAFAAPERPNWISQRWIVEKATRGFKLRSMVNRNYVLRVRGSNLMVEPDSPFFIGNEEFTIRPI
ncbi:phosphatidylinositol-specific phospholipase C domain-containing protein [Bacillus thuringiensis]|uniref:phosphatidylinositol-specific phospholipase C domain-containing protein n=1 Tax=Bacillus thuringiensis TaxID=1428 RepID=UPI002D7EBAE0|nr:phosphatidylinositol-specific phospholipase C domain-containing protein [Bacillus thuringiensis]MEB4815738.1 phosphatidylinositol-specific phospholipase C domain-containing protein [Bacillus thuringiensis]